MSLFEPNQFRQEEGQQQLSEVDVFMEEQLAMAPKTRRYTSQQPEPMDDEDVTGTEEEEEGESVFTERIEEILRRQSMREEQQSTSPSVARQQQQAAQSGETVGGPFTSAELGELSLLCTQQASEATTTTTTTENGKNGFAVVPGDLLTSLVLLLHQHVQAASTLDLFKQAATVLKEQPAGALQEWLKDESLTHAKILRGGLEAANVILQIAVTKGVDQRAINEDALEAILTLYRLHMREHTIPTINETAHTSFQSEKDSHGSEAISPPRKRRRSSATEKSTHRLAKELKKMYKLVSSTFNLYFVLMERMELLMNSMLLEDHQVLLITNSSMQVFEIECQIAKDNFGSGHQMQLASISIVAAAFRKYPQHRDSILEELFPILLKLPTAKRSLRAYRVRYASAASSSLTKLNSMLIRSMIDPGMAANHSIQMVTGLVLALVQSCVVRPTYEEMVAVAEGEEAPPFPQFASGLKECQHVSIFIVDQLMKRCTKSKYGGGTVEFRSFMTHFVLDLLSVMMIPEYPAAEMILYTLMQRLRHDITQASDAGPGRGSNGAGTENTYVTFAFELFGKVCSFEARLLKLARDYSIEVGRDRVIKEGEVVIDCYCGNQTEDHFTVGCDDCNTFFHGKCVGLVNMESIPEEWLCDACRLARIAKREMRVKHCRDTSFMNGPYIMRHAFLSSLAHRTGVENIEPAVQFHFARWLDALQTKLSESSKSSPVQKPTKQLLHQLVNQWDLIEAYGEPMTDEGYNRMLLALFARSSPMGLSFKHQVNLVLKMMVGINSHLRKLSLKTIEKVAEGDDRLMLMPAITRTVSSRLADTTISVREAALSFIGSYAASFPRVATAFHPSLIMCLGDAGVSVRKRAIRIFNDILSTNPHYKGRSEACDAMLKRAAFRKEEDTVRDLIYELFSKLWLEDADQIVAAAHPSPRKAPPSAVDSPGNVASPGPKRKTATLSSPHPLFHLNSHIKRVELAAVMMMETIRTAGTGNHLETFLKKLYDASLDEERGRRRKSRGEISRQHIDKLIQALFEVLLKLEETRADRGDMVGKDIAATLRTIEILSATEPFPVIKHLDTILPYLKADNGVQIEDEALIVSACCDILFRISSAFDDNDLHRFTSSVAGDLRQIVFKFNAGPMNSAIRTLSALAHHQSATDDSHGRILLDIAQVFYSYLLRHLGTPDFSPGKVSEKIRCNLHRALTVLGCICQHRDRSLGSADEQDFLLPEEDLAPPKSISWANSTMASYQVIAEYLKKQDNPTKCASLKALGFIFLNEPRLLFALEQVGLVDDIMSPKAPTELQLEALDVWKKILESEEKRIDAGEATEKMARDTNITVTKRISGDQDGDANLFGGVLTNHADRLFDMLSSKDVRMRFSSLELLGLLLRQGLVNPNDAVPHLLALQGDVDNDTIRSLALEFLITEGEKRPDMIRQRVRAGVKQAYTFQRTIYPQRAQVSAVFQAGDRVECVFAKVFVECVARIRKQKHGLFASLLGLFEWKEFGRKKGSSFGQRSSPLRGKTGADLSLLSFAAQILAHLPYSSADDPLFIIHKLSSISALQGDQILEKFNELLPKTQHSEDDWDDENEDSLERAAITKFPGRTKAAQPLTDGNYDLRSFAKHCQTSASFTLLMRLKAYLQKMYRLSDLRCIEYDPKGKERIADRSCHRIENPPPFDASLPAGLGNTSAAPNVDSLIRQYAEFRKAFRDEMATSAKAEEQKDELPDDDPMDDVADDSDDEEES